MLTKFTVVEEGAQIPDDTDVWYFTHVCSGAKIGHGSNIGNSCYIGHDVIVGNNVRVGNNVSLYPGLVVKDNVFIGNNTTFTNVRRPRIGQQSKYEITVIEEGAYVGANSTVVGGVRIGKRCRIADGTVIFSNVPDDTYVVSNFFRGISTRIVKDYKKNEEEKR